MSALQANRTDVRTFLTRLLRKGLAGSSIQLHTAALRSFYRFVRMSGLSDHDPTLLLPQRKVSHRLPRVLSVAEVEALINAARNPFEQAVPEFMYSTACRVSELVALELKNVDLAEHLVLFKHTKGRKDRYVPFGRHAAKAIFEYLKWRPSQKYLFEAPARTGQIYLDNTSLDGTVLRQSRPACHIAWND